MGRDDFMAGLEKELQDISQIERDNALLYYKNYFDDAGDANEEDVISKLDSPGAIAQEIKRDLGESAKTVTDALATAAAPSAPSRPAAPAAVLGPAGTGTGR